ncbi:MAG: fasciclin domain-containing protein [Planctomycetota bacterium]|nr:fasciclin domain-containing protein [Planctomycetota bacterium]
MKLIALAALAAAALFTPAVAQDCSKTCSGATMAGEGRGSDIVSTALAAGNFKTLATALGAAGLVDTLKGEGPFTVFAPTDEAFAKVPREVLADLLKPENKAKLVDVLTYHVVAGKVLAADVVKLKSAGTVNGQRVDIRVVEGTVSIDGAKVTKTDIQCSNGVIHVIDSVILPSSMNLVETASRAGTFKTLLAAATAAGLAETLMKDGPFTILAPTDEAFAKLPAGTVESLLKPENKEKLANILKLHVISGRVFADQVVKMTEAPTLAGRKLTIVANRDGVTIGGAKVTATDIDAKNGVIHVIDTVILPG